MNSVEQFIQKFQSPESIKMFSGDCSYWFASILYRRFIREGATIMFNPDTKCFGTMIKGTVYNISGNFSSKDGWISWLNFQDTAEKQIIIDKYIMF